MARTRIGFMARLSLGHAAACIAADRLSIGYRWLKGGTALQGAKQAGAEICERCHGHERSEQEMHDDADGSHGRSPSTASPTGRPRKTAAVALCTSSLR